MVIETDRKELLFALWYDLYVDLNAVLTDDSFPNYSYLFVSSARFNSVESEVLGNWNNMSSHMLSQHCSSFHDSKHQVYIVSQRSIGVEGIPEIVIVEGSFYKKEVVHDESINLCQLIDGSCEGVDSQVIFHVEMIDQAEGVDENIHADVGRVPR